MWCLIAPCQQQCLVPDSVIQSFSIYNGPASIVTRPRGLMFQGMMGCFLVGVRESHSVQTGLSPHNTFFSGYQGHLARGKLAWAWSWPLTSHLVVWFKMCCAVFPLHRIPLWHGTALHEAWRQLHLYPFIWSGRLRTIDFKFVIHSWAAERMIQIAWVV